MTKSTKKSTGSGRGKARRRRWLEVSGGIALLILVPVACELTKWRALPDGPPPGDATGPVAGSDEAALAEAAVSEWLADVPVTGLAACMAVEGRVVWCSAHGYSDVGEREPLTVRTPMRIGSVSKTVTAILLARLLDRGLVELDRPIGEIVPELPDHLHAITLRQLASHTAGVRHYSWRFDWPPHETWSREPYASVAASLAVFADDAPIFSPGTGFQYSTHGYTLLGAVLERAGGAGFGELLEREIVVPAGLASTGLESTPLGPGQARAYEIVAGRYRAALTVDNSRGWPGGGVLSSAHDLAVLMSALPATDLVARETLESFLTPQTLANGDGNPQNYALGWRLAQTREFLGGKKSYRVAHHGGVSSGGSAFVALFPDESVAVALLTNTRTGSGALVELAFEIAEPLMGVSR